MTNRTRLEIEPGLVLDARRSAWLAPSRTLIVSDLHLGYAWTHRQAGQLLPISSPDDTLSRLTELISDYDPEQVVLLGDIIHGSSDVKAVREQLHELTECIGSRARLRLVEGNHDFTLGKLLRRNASALKLEARVDCDPHLLLHGHTLGADRPKALLDSVRARKGRVIFGHEHPAVRISDGVASSARCPCFLMADGALVLPSFSHWSAGGSVNGRMMSPLGEELVFADAVAVIAGKLLRVPAG